MDINRLNYEATLIDFMEGNLSKAEVSELFLFLDANPDIKAEFDMFQNDIPSIASTTIDFPSKEKLIKRQVGNDFLDEFSWLCIAKLEGDATPTELVQLQNLIKNNPSLNEEYLLFEKLRLQPAETVIFDQKSQLARHRIGFASSLARYAVAASVAAIIVMISFSVENNHNDRQLAIISTIQYSTIKSIDTVSNSSTGTVAIVNVDKLKVPSRHSSAKDTLSKNSTVITVSQRTDTAPMLATITPIGPSVKVEVGHNLTLQDNFSDREQVKNMNPAENPSRYLSVGEFLAQKVVGGNSIDPTFASSSSSAKFWQVAQVGIRGASRLLGIPVKIDKEYDQGGNLKKISIDSKLLALSRTF